MTLRRAGRLPAGRALVLLLPTLFTLGFAEIGLRSFGLGEIVEYAPSEDFGYLMRPSQEVSSYGVPVHFNSLGFRGEEVSEHKRPGAFRIAFLGDSVTYGGARLADEEVFPAILRSQLSRGGRLVETLSVAAPGWSPQNWIGYVAARGLHGADLVILVLPECDLARTFATIENRGFEEHSPPLRLISVLLFSWSAVRQIGTSTELPFIIDPPASAAFDRRQVAANVAAVRRLVALCRARGVSLLAVYVPSLPKSRYSEYWHEFEALVPDPLDLRGTLTAPEMFQDGVHLSRNGHRLVASQLESIVAPHVESTVRVDSAM